MPGFDAVAESSVSGVFGDSELTSVVFLDYPLYSMEASDRIDLVLSYNEAMEPLYPDSLGYSLGDIAIGLTPYVRVPMTYNVTVSETLNFIQTPNCGHLYNKSLTDTLTFTQSAAGGRTKYRTVTDTLVFTELPGRSTNKSVSDTLTFTETVTVKHVINKSVSDVLIFNQSATRNNTYKRLVSESLNFTETPRKQKVATRTTSDLLFFVDVVKKVFDRSAHDTLVFNETFKPGHLRTIHVSERLNFNETTIAPRIIIRSVSDFLKFQQAKIIIPTGAITVEIPFAQYTIIRNCDSFILETDYVILESPDTTVILPTPLFDDTDVPALKVDIKRTMGNQVYSFIKRNLLHTLHYEFAIGRKKSLELQQFLNDNTGKFIWLKNWRGEVWYGNILTNPTITTLRSRYDNEREKATITVEFAGVKL